MAKQKFDRSKPHLERGDDGTHRPREDDPDGSDHESGAVGRAMLNSRRMTKLTTRPKKKRAVLRSTSRTSNTRPPSATMPTWTCLVTATTSRT
jgi:hypothetical protein